MRRFYALAALVVVSATPLLAQGSLSTADQAAAFEAAGFKLEGGQWRSCGDPGTPAYDPGEIARTRDLNGDGRPEALIMESSTFCFGVTGAGYTIVSKQADGTWKLITSGSGIPTFLPVRGVGNWPDIEVGLPGFCYPVRRWNGTAYAIDRHQYEGKPCRKR